MWIAEGIAAASAIALAAGMSVAAMILAVKYRLLKGCIRQAGRDMAQILENPGENRILLAACPSREAEELLREVNLYIQYHQRERAAWQGQERQLQEQVENISHDLRTPLTSIRGYLELVDGRQLSREDRESLAVVERKSRYLQELIGDFYDLSRLERADMRLRQEPVEVGRLARETLLSYYPEFEKKHLEVELELPETEVMVRGDRGAVERLLHNLVQNALRYARSRFRVCVHDAGQQGKGRQVCMEFINDTDHLAQADIPHLFERFYTADPARPGGTGLGLAISRLLAEAMGGEAAAELTEQGELHIKFAFWRAAETEQRFQGTSKTVS